eukprot:7391671-Prymnesium_polylepis.1
MYRASTGAATSAGSSSARIARSSSGFQLGTCVGGRPWMDCISSAENRPRSLVSVAVTRRGRAVVGAAAGGSVA